MNFVLNHAFLSYFLVSVAGQVYATPRLWPDTTEALDMHRFLLGDPGSV